MFCPHCGASGLGTDGTCEVCGQTTAQASIDLEPYLTGEKIEERCPTCGSVLEIDEVFCGQCGMRVRLTPSSGLSLASGDLHFTGTSSHRIGSQRLLSVNRQQPPDWDGQAPQGRGTPTDEAYRHSQTLRSAIHSSSPRSTIGQSLTHRQAQRERMPADTASPHVVSRSRAALIISLLCFLASLISGSAAIWLLSGILH